MEAEVRARFEHIEGILASVAKRQAAAEARADRADARMDRFERQMAAARKLVETGMRMLVRIEGSIEKLADSQRQTNRKLQAFIDSLRKGGGNGRR